MEAVKNMNGTIWIFAVILVGFVVVQSLLFLILAVKTNRKYKALTKAEVSQAIKTGAVSSIGPAFSTMTIALSLIVMVGSATTFMRCGVIGAPAWELMMAQISSQAVGVEFGTSEFTEAVFTLCIFGMTLASAPYFINTIITLKPMDALAEKGEAAAEKGGRSFLPYVSNAAMMGILGYMILDYFTSIASVLAGLTAAGVCYAVMQFSKKIDNKMLASFNMAIAMIAGMIVGQVVTMITG